MRRLYSYVLDDGGVHYLLKMFQEVTKLSSRMAIDVLSLYKYYGDVKAVDGLTLKVEEGIIYGLIGPNGAGKSTTIMMLVGQLKPDKGTINVLGFNIPKERFEMRKYLGYMPQDIAIYEDLTVQENMFFVGKILGLKGNALKEKTMELLEFFGLDEKKKEMARDLSGGMKRRLMLAMAWINDPKIFIGDECTVGVDPVLRREFWKFFREKSDEGVTILITTHVMDEAFRTDKVGLMYQGKLIFEDHPENISEQHDVQALENLFFKHADLMTSKTEEIKK